MRTNLSLAVTDEPWLSPHDKHQAFFNSPTPDHATASSQSRQILHFVERANFYTVSSAFPQQSASNFLQKFQHCECDVDACCSCFAVDG
jgi:hypothetical protein